MSAIEIKPPDHLRDAALHAHADLRVGIKMLRKGRFITAWRKMQKGYDRLDKALDTRSPEA